MAERLWRGVEARKWPESPHTHIEVTVALKQHPYHVTVVFGRDDDNNLEPVVISAFRNDAGRLSTRDVKRLPLERVVAGAQTIVSNPTVRRALATGRGDATIDVAALDRSTAPRGRPKLPSADPRKRYEVFAAMYRRYAARPDIPSPAQAVADKLGVPVNRVYWWKHQAKHRYGITV